MPRLNINDQYTDLELVELVKGGETRFFNFLVNRHKTLISRTIKAMVGNINEANDIGQDTFIRFYMGIEMFRGESQLSTYLVRIAINLSLNYLKKISKQKFITIFKEDLIHPLVMLENQDSQANVMDNNEIINKALCQLDPQSRAVVTLRLIDGYSVKETAEMLGLPLGTVLSKQSRAQDKLKVILKNHI
jgi:RNA polymerase sigma-70 factor (ECF subfamily)